MNKDEVKKLIMEMVMSGDLRSQVFFPLDDKSRQALKSEAYLVGSATLANGTMAIKHFKIKSTSTPMVCYQTFSANGTLRAVCTDGTLTITSSSGTDASVINYIIII